MEKNYFFGIDVSKETLDVALYEKSGNINVFILRVLSQIHTKLRRLKQLGSETR